MPTKVSSGEVYTTRPVAARASVAETTVSRAGTKRHDDLSSRPSLARHMGAESNAGRPCRGSQPDCVDDRRRRKCEVNLERARRRRWYGAIVETSLRRRRAGRPLGGRPRSWPQADPRRTDSTVASDGDRSRSCVECSSARAGIGCQRGDYQPVATPERLRPVNSETRAS